MLTRPWHLSMEGHSESSEGLVHSAGLCLCLQHGIGRDLRSGAGSSQ
ncbi:MAG: hypothetical protein K0R40_543 [Burkholderiales bacterium]|jgi:hypothetical protein|nr:hypothetical protein [Burkholderiales bacterium]